MTQKISEENIENNLVFCIDPRKVFAFKSKSRSVYRNSPHKNNIHVRLFSISVKFGFRFLYKTMTTQTVYLNNFARKSGFTLQFLSVCLLNSPLSERSDDLSNEVRCMYGIDLVVTTIIISTTKRKHHFVAQSISFTRYIEQGINLIWINNLFYNTTDYLYHDLKFRFMSACAVRGLRRLT